MLTDLLAGRNKNPLTDTEIRRGVSYFLALDGKAPVKYESGARTGFRPPLDGEDDAEIVFGEDLYPGPSVLDPNSFMSPQAVAAHELSHYHRWRDKIALSGVGLQYLDEALTSLDAIARFAPYLGQLEVRQLAADAALRLQLHVKAMTEKP